MSQRRKNKDEDEDRDSQSEDEDSKAVDPEAQGGGKMFYILIVLVIPILFLGMREYFKGEDGPDESYDRTQKQSEFLKFAGKLRAYNFPSQSDQTFRILNGLVKSSLEDKEPAHPASIVLLIPPTMDSKFPQCFLRKLGAGVHHAHGSKDKINELNLKNVGPKVQTELKSYFDRGGRVVMVEQIEKSQESKNLLLFNSFCDDTKAYQKRAVFFFIVQVPQNIYEKYKWNPKNAGEISNEVLNEAWKNVLNEDKKRVELIGRVARSTVLLNDGDSCVE